MAIHYTPNQQRAIDHLDGNLQIIACAGSGKTQVLAQRIVNILKVKKAAGITPKNIVAFTFTEKAAGELKDRIYTLCRAEFGEITGLADMYVGTIHAFCLELLQQHLYKFLKYSVLSEVQQRLLIDRSCVKCGLTTLSTLNGQPLKRWQDSRLYQKVLSLVREAQLDETVLGAHPIREALAKYEAVLHDKRYLDYSMLLTETVKELASNTDLQSKIRQRVKFLIVDEYQDVNPLQECLIKLLHGLGAQLCVVGDDDQTIYQWNGSDIQNILTFSQRYPNVTSITLDDNFRSSKGVVETARRVAEQNVAERLRKNMTSTGAQSFELGNLLYLKFDDPAAEAQWIARKIRDMAGTPFTEKQAPERGLTWADCAILLRSVKNSAEPILAALRAAEIPYVVKGMTGLFDAIEIQAATGIFHFLADTLSPEDLKQHWRDAHLGLTDTDLDAGIAWLQAERAAWPSRWQKSSYSLQQTFKGFLEKIKITEECIPTTATTSSGVTRGSRGELVFFNLGKFSQVISDFEMINFLLDPTRLYKDFSGFLQYQAPDYYPEGWETAGYHQPDAVQVMTVHQAKGMEFPVVFIPNLAQNRFPSKRMGGRNWTHVLPQTAVKNADRYLGNVADERRLFYVALTRSKKYLYCTWAPGDNRLYKKPSEFAREYVDGGRSYVLTAEPARPAITKLPPKTDKTEMEIGLTFSELKYYFDCPYQFKLRFLYGFNPGFHEKIGFGKSLHDALAEIHRRALDRQYLTEADTPALLDNHLHLPYAWTALKEDMRQEADKALRRYLHDNGDILDKIEHSELPIELKLGDGVVVRGRIDLIRRTDTNQVVIIDFKSTSRAQEEAVTRAQLDIYALGYQQLTGRKADVVEIYNLDKGAGASTREAVDDRLLAETSQRVQAAGLAIRDNQFCRKTSCGGCDFSGICR